jgi:pimeloyl-ACP methyl ester carboxylesterase
MRILFIHGIDQGGRDPQVLEQIWTETLQERYSGAWPKTLKIDFPYYGDVLDALVAQSKLPTPADLVAKGAGQDLGFEEFMQSALEEMKDGAHLPQAEIDAHLEPGPATESKGAQNSRVLLALARTIDARWTGVVNFGIAHLLKEVYVYVDRPAAQRQIDAIVEAKLTDEPTIVVGHSLGSVVAYNLVRKHRRTLDLRRLITVGSPLGLRAISSKLGVLENGAAKAGWYNAFDPTDIVALRPLDDRWFPVDPAIVNDDTVRNSADNRHGIIGYLDHGRLAEQVTQAIAAEGG